MRLIAAVGSNTGKVRRMNEDNFCLDGRILPQINRGSPVISRPLSQGNAHLVGVFDGMGGHGDGEKAAHLTALTAQYYAEHLSGYSDYVQMLQEFCFAANDTVCDAPGDYKMGTTAAVLCLDADRYTLCNIGDSPIFLFRQNQLLQLSEEHTQRATYERVTGKPAKPGKKFHLTQNIGIPRDEMILEPYCAQGDILPGDIFLLCSDGLTDMLPPERISSILAHGESAEAMTQDLIQGALDAGGVDNVTVLCVQAVGAPAPCEPLKQKRPGKKAVWLAAAALLAILALAALVYIITAAGNRGTSLPIASTAEQTEQTTQAPQSESEASAAGSG